MLLAVCLPVWLARNRGQPEAATDQTPTRTLEPSTGIPGEPIAAVPQSAAEVVPNHETTPEPPPLPRLEDLMQREAALSNKEYFSQADKLFNLVCADLASGALSRNDLRRLIEQLAASVSPRQRSMGWALAAADGGLENMQLLQAAYHAATDPVIRTELLMRMAKCTARIEQNLADWTALLSTEQDSSLRRGIMGALARNGSAEVVAFLVERINSTSSEERSAWISSLAQVSNPASFPSLNLLATGMDSPDIAQAALNAIATSQQTGSAKMLMELYAAKPNEGLQAAVLDALARTRDEGNWTTLKDELHFGTDVKRRSAAARALVTGYAAYNPSAVHSMLTKLLGENLPEALRAEVQQHLQSINKRPTTEATGLTQPAQPSSESPKVSDQ